MSNVQIRNGEKKDIPSVLILIKELAVYEKLAHEVEITQAQLEEDGFGANPLFGLIVALESDIIIGIVIYYFRYSTWKGKRLYIEDIVVTEQKRGFGIGKQLFDFTIHRAKELNCKGINWLVLGWNKSAINFYDRYQPTYDDTWVVASMSNEQVVNF